MAAATFPARSYLAIRTMLPIDARIRRMSFRDAGESTDFLNLIYMLVCGTFVSTMTFSPQSGLDSRVGVGVGLYKYD